VRVTSIVVSLVASVVISGCAVTSAPAGMKADQFVSYTCATGKGFKARYNADSKSVRVRAQHSAVELQPVADGKYASDDYALDTTAAGGATLTYQGKPEGAQCKVE
jgi:hypothetical protein